MKTRLIAGGVVIGPNNKIVVVNQHGNSWSLPKGGIDPGETDRQAAEREIKEESGLDKLIYMSDLGSYERGRIGKEGHGEIGGQNRHLTFFLYKTDQIKLAPEDPENPEARWVDIENVSDLLTHTKDKDFFSSIIPKIKKHL
jgi:8-oxo-dGTP pyrophosphatase MutT (NUDIX family)